MKATNLGYFSKNSFLKHKKIISLHVHFPHFSINIVLQVALLTIANIRIARQVKIECFVTCKKSNQIPAAESRPYQSSLYSKTDSTNLLKSCNDQFCRSNHFMNSQMLLLLSIFVHEKVALVHIFKMSQNQSC